MMRVKSFFGGTVIATLGGLIGLGGAEFRLPFFVGILRIETVRAVVLNLLISLVTVVFALLFRGIEGMQPAHWLIAANLLAGTMAGAYFGAHTGSKIDTHRLHGYIFYLLLFLSVVLFSHIFISFESHFALPGAVQIGLGLGLGFGIGTVSSLLGVAGGELLIPVIVLVYGIDIKTAGTLSLAISLPTLLVGIAKYKKTGKLAGALDYKSVLYCMAAGSILGALIGAAMMGIVNTALLEGLLAVILLLSAVKLFFKRDHKKGIQ